MAGIGLDLKNLLKKDSYLSLVLGYIQGSLISSGPWILTVICLFGLDYVARQTLDDSGRLLFLGTVTFCFIMSLVLTGLLQMSVARMVSDHLYQQKFENVLPSFLTACLFVVVGTGSIGILLWGFSEHSLLFRFFAIQLFVTVSLLWMVLIYQTLAREYTRIVIAYEVGTAISFGLGITGAVYFGVEGLLGGFTIGQMITLIWLVTYLITELPKNMNLDGALWGNISNMPVLIFIGLFYNLAIWIDKMTFWWFAPESQQISWFVYIHPQYDSAAFLTFLTVIPVIALFVMRLEVTFFRSYRTFYLNILNNKPLQHIQEAHREIAEKVQLSIWRMIKMQGVICFLTVVFAPWLVEWLDLAFLEVTTVRLMAIGASFHILFYLISLFLLYFDFQMPVLWLMIAFAVINAAGTLVTINLGPRFYGLGYLTAGFILFLISYQVLNSYLKHLDYDTFVEKSGARERT